MRQKLQKAKKHADYAAFHYGFDLVDIKETVHAGKSDSKTEEERIKVLKYYAKDHESELKRDIPQRMMFYNKAILKEKSGNKAGTSMGFDVVGVNSGLAEALVIQTALSILKGEGYKNLSIEINSIGDKESVKDFTKDLTAFYRRNAESLSAAERKKVAEGKAMELFVSDKEHLVELNADCPRPINYLSEESSKHFAEVLEYLEQLDAPYMINDTLMGHQNYFSKTIFTIKGKGPKEKEAKIVARGGRYDELASEVTRKRKISATGLSMHFKPGGSKLPKLAKKEVDLHLIKIGFQARLKSLEVMEIVKDLGLPLGHSLDETKISKQIEHAMTRGSEYALILGQKEANEDKVLVRDMDTLAQEDVKLADLSKYLKKIG